MARDVPGRARRLRMGALSVVAAVVGVSSGRLLLSFVQAACWGPSRSLQVRRAAESTPGEPSEPEEEDTTNVELFRQSLIQGWASGGSVGGASGTSDWAEPIEPADVRPGDILLGDPASFFGEGASNALRRVGLQERIPADYPRRERLRYLPVVLLTEVDKESDTARGVWLTLRTGRLLGDLIDVFHSRPLLYGGPASSEGVTMVHPYPQVEGSKPLSDGGLYLGGSLAGAQAFVEDGTGSSLRIRFFLNRIEWNKGEFAADLDGDGRSFLPVRCSVDVVLTETDAVDAKPLWAKVAELAGGAVAEAGRQYDLL
ncbi:unnamed protein product [Symbiodinium natans]|uniref:Uncharacterized protein n=1 Tax=Symbiodinium natans TaxID=878477 RepID=A0A812I172_9DINO|nr:unnamed protein product [Symbiodinium natans]